ncbi:MAG: type II toxin-antitoxin system RelE/ParE family toxin [bacterium]|nr:type II toxin-antitoxin system RelE/ParE family toxin [bacterium]
MPTKVSTPPEFLKQVKRLARKYPTIPKAIHELIFELEADNRPGDQVPNVGYEVYKVRLKNPDSQRGKSSGFRLIYYLQMMDAIVLLIIYSKTERNDISPSEIRELIENLASLDNSNDNQE